MLTRDGEPVALTPKAFETLVVLVERSGHLVEKDELMKRLWADVYVEESNLTNNIWVLRKALGERESGERFIETVPKRGYRFVGEVRELPTTRDEAGAQENLAAQENVVAQENILAPPVAVEEQKTLHDDATLPLASGSSAIGNEKYVPSSSSSRRVAFAVLCVFVVAGACVALYKFAWAEGKRDAAFSETQVARLTNTGKTSLAAISADGKYYAYVSASAEGQSIRVSQIAAESAMQVVSPLAQDVRALTFTPDGNYLCYVARERNSTVGTLYQVPVLGGVPKRVATDVDSPVAFKPDGTRFAFVRRNPFEREDALILLDTTGGGAEQRLATRRYPEFFYISGGLAWSPDGSRIATGAGSFEENHHQLDVIAVNVNEGKITRLSNQKWHEVAGLAWLKTGTALLLAASDERNGIRQLWHLSLATGAGRRVTNDINDYRGVSLTADAGALVTTQVTQHSDIWTVAVDAEAQQQSKQLTSGKYDGFYGLDWTPRNEIVYGSTASGKPHIWIMNDDGTNQRLLNEESESSPAVSPDGRHILFASSREDAVHIWRMDADGRNPAQLTRGSGELWQTWTPDNRWIVFAAIGANRNTLWKISADEKSSVDNFAPVQITQEPTTKPVVSPDGKWIACVRRADPASPWQVAVIPFEGGAPLRVFESIPDAYFQTFRWTPDGRALSYIDSRDGVANIWRQDLDGNAAPQRITNFAGDERIFSFAWSRDGRRLTLARGAISTDVVVMKDLR
jgi:Tol biopolymer transport system component/DNA-binding winged helix-turn-helix (wHTH) protein